jgi:hypothetical protein
VLRPPVCDLANLPETLFIDDLARLFRVGRSTIERLHKLGRLPFPECGSLTRRPAWSKREVLRYRQENPRARLGRAAGRMTTRVA